MANHAATKKDVRQSTRRNERNRYYGKTTRNAIRDIRTITEQQAASDKMPVVASMIDKPVSYTHLDVYKRQAMLRPLPFIAMRQ